MKKHILVVAAHPDDEILGCGGTIARLIKKEYEAHLMILGEGVTSRDEKREKLRRKKEIEALKQQVRKANDLIGVNKIFTYDFPDNRFDEVPLLDIIKVIEKIKVKIRPDIVYTHHKNDLNVDHQITFNAVLTACRPLKGETVKEIYSFEVPSSTEWNYPYTFSPNVYIDISSTLDQKIKALGVYETEVRKFPHPRSKESVKNIAKRWGSIVGLDYAEVFEVIRIIK